MPNALTRFIEQRRGCDSAMCGTCGGLLLFVGSLHCFLDGRDDLAVLLRGVREADVLRLPVGGRDLPPLLSRLTHEERNSVIASWQKGIGRVPSFAEALLAVMGDDINHYPILKREILAVLLTHSSTEAATRYVGARRTRDVLDRVLGAELSANESFTRARAFDRYVDEQEAQRATARSQARELARLELAEAARCCEERIAQVDALTLIERLELIALDLAGVAQPLPVHWAMLSEEDIQKIPNDLRVSLQRRLRDHRRGPWRRLRGLLHAFHSKQQARERSALLAQLAALGPMEQLALLSESTHPIGRFPLSLASLGLEQVGAMRAQLQESLRTRLASTRRGPWRKLYQAVDGSARPYDGT